MDVEKETEMVGVINGRWMICWREPWLEKAGILHVKREKADG